MRTTRIRIGQQNRQWPALHWCCRGAGGPLQRRRDWLQRTRHSPPAHGLPATLPKATQRATQLYAASRTARSTQSWTRSGRWHTRPSKSASIWCMTLSVSCQGRPEGYGLAAHARWYPDATAGGACRSESNRERKRMTWQRSAAERSCELAWLPWAEDAVLARALLRTCSVIGWPTLAKKSRSSSSES
jgi:hypothetical protein